MSAAMSMVVLVTGGSSGIGQASAAVCDVSDGQQVRKVLDEVMAEYGRLDGAVNNAGMTVCIQEALWLMQAHGARAVVNTCSIRGLTGSARYVAYAASKHSVAGATKSLALEVAGAGIRVNAVCPGYVETPMNMSTGLKLDDDTTAFEAIRSQHPMSRLGQPEKVASAIHWLLSDASSFVTGHLLSVDGGFVVP